MGLNGQNLSNENKEHLYSVAEVEEVFNRFSLQRPNPKGELHYVNDFTLLIAVLMSAQTTDAAVNKATQELFRIADSPSKIVALGEEKTGQYIRTVGLWINKAKNIVKLSKILLHDFEGKIPSNREALEKLPGVGRKTANVVLNLVFGLNVLAVDTHIFRIGNRTGLAVGKTPERVEKAFMNIIPPHYMQNAHLWLVLHGRYICKAKKPLCQICCISDICKASENRRQNNINK